jgi:hypothetical protein
MLADFRKASVANRAPDALAIFDRMPDRLKSDPAIRAQAAALAGSIGDRHREITMTHELLKQFPSSPELHVALAFALRTIGSSERGIEHLRSAIRLRPGYGAPWRILAEMRPDALTDRDVAEVRALLSQNLDGRDAVALHFALSWALEARGDHAGVAEHVIAGNAIDARLRGEVPTPPETLAERSRAVLDGDIFRDRRRDGNPSAAPIFVLGLPRSGSTLVEQILASHSDVEATTELPVLPQVLQDLARQDGVQGARIVDHVAAFPAERLRALGDAYLAGAEGYRRTDRRHFVDKLPGNWSHSALIRLIFPNAAMIDTRRHAMATGWSIFRHHFPGGPGYATSQREIGLRIRANRRMMAFMDEAAPGAVHRVLHESLVNDLEGEVRALLGFCGLSYQHACLDFHRGNRVISTASSDQVRRPIGSSGIDRWRSYRAWLGELEAVLGDEVGNGND